MKIALSTLTCSFALVMIVSVSQQRAVGLELFSDANDGFIEFRTDPGTWPQVHPSFDGSGGEGFFANTGEWFGTGLTSAVLQFELPDFGSVVDPFLTADLGVHLFEMGNATVSNVDLYAIRTASVPDLLATDYYSGSAIDNTAGVTLIQEDFLTPASIVSSPAAPNNFTDPTGDAALLSYLNTAYNGGTGAGDYVFLRLSYAADGLAAGWDAYKVTTRNAGGGTGDYPVITFTTNNLPGDVDGDGDVDLVEADFDMISDFDIIRNNWLETNDTFGQTLQISDGDLDLDGEVGISDFRAWKDVFSGSPAEIAAAFASLATVPEPSSAALVLVSFIVIAAGARKR